MVTAYEDSAYDVLGLSPTADAAEIRASYLRLARLTHPDVGGSDALFRRVETAYATLSDPARRRAYDLGLAAAEPTEEPGSEAPSDGWVRVDDPPASAHRARHWVRLRQWLQPSSRVRRDARRYDNRRSTWQVLRPRLRSLRMKTGAFLRRHPWVGLTVGGLVASQLAPDVGTLLFLAGLVAGVGASRARRNASWSGVAPSGISLLFAELAAGLAILFRILWIFVGTLFMMFGLADSHTSSSRRSGW